LAGELPANNFFTILITSIVKGNKKMDNYIHLATKTIKQVMLLTCILGLCMGMDFRGNSNNTQAMNKLPIGSIILSRQQQFDHLPSNWVPCQGQSLNQLDYQELYNAIGIIWGAGQHISKTFELPTAFKLNELSKYKKQVEWSCDEQMALISEISAINQDEFNPKLETRYIIRTK